MANSEYKITHSNYVLRKRHQSVSGGTVYERDFMTTTNLGQWDSGSIPYGESNFRFVYRPTSNSKKAPTNLQWENWTLEKVNGYEKTSEDEVKLKPNYSSLLDFAYYGSCTELVKSTISKIIRSFPPTLIVGEEHIINGVSYNIVENPFEMDLFTALDSTETGSDILKDDKTSYESGRTWGYMSEAWSGYTIGGTDIKSYSIVKHDPCSNDGILREVRLNGYAIYEILAYGSSYLFMKGLKSGQTISPKKELIEEYFSKLDDFENLLLNRDSNPIYTARLDWPHETETGVKTYKKDFTWPSNSDGSIDIISAKYGEYIKDLLDLAEFYDENYTDNLWRMLTHDSIKNMDMTFSMPGRDEDEEDYNIGTSRMHGLLWVIGRQFDDIKRAIDNIKYSNRITYQGDNNLPDYYLTDTLNLSGWETYDIGEALSGYTIQAYSSFGIKDVHDYTDASVEFLKNLKLNSNAILSRKGTKQSIEYVLGLFGLVSKDFARAKYKREHNGSLDGWSEGSDITKWDYEINEYVAVAKGINGSPGEIEKWNRTRAEYPTSAGEVGLDGFYGIPVAEVAVDNGTNYIVPWFDKGERYDAGTYFQMYGGWLKNDNTYGETVKYLHAVDTHDDLNDVTEDKLYNHRICYVIDEGKYYEKGDGDSAEWVEISSGDTKVQYLNSIVERKDGNNPHAGYGRYDSGEEYIDRFRKLFKYEVENDSADKQMFKDDENMAYDCSTGELNPVIKTLGFNIDGKAVDSQKVWYFKNTADNCKCENLSIVEKEKEYAPGYDNIFKTEMRPYNFEMGGRDDYMNVEGAENSIINLKNIKLTIYTMFPEFKETYFKECILPYITQVIPSTAIFEYEIIVAGSTKILETTGAKLNVVSVDGIVGTTGEDTSDDIIFNYNKGGRKSDGGREQLKVIR